MAKIRNSSMTQSNKDLDIKLIQDGWTSMKGPKNWVTACFLSVPFIIINALILIGIINIFSNVSLQEFGYKTDGSVSITIYLWDILFVILLVSVHEFLHLVSLFSTCVTLQTRNNKNRNTDANKLIIFN